ncbi:hypothetical protein ACFLUV_00925 [Elusimicrobiota bacterium]
MIRKIQTACKLIITGKIKVLFNKTLEYLFFYEKFFILSCLFKEMEVKYKPRGITSRLAGMSDLNEINRWKDDSGYTFENRDLNDTHICIVAESGGKLVGMEWAEITESHYEHRNNYNFPLSQDSVWLYCGYVVPEYRIKGVWVGLQTGLIDYFSTGSVEKGYCLIYKKNKIAINTHIRFGYKVECRVIHLKILFINFHFVKRFDGKKDAAGKI